MSSPSLPRHIALGRTHSQQSSGGGGGNDETSASASASTVPFPLLPTIESFPDHINFIRTRDLSNLTSVLNHLNADETDDARQYASAQLLSATAVIPNGLTERETDCAEVFTYIHHVQPLLMPYLNDHSADSMSADSDDDFNAIASAQLLRCMSAVPAKYFDESVDPIMEAFNANVDADTAAQQSTSPVTSPTAAYGRSRGDDERDLQPGDVSLPLNAFLNPHFTKHQPLSQQSRSRQTSARRRQTAPANRQPSRSPTNTRRSFLSTITQAFSFNTAPASKNTVANKQTHHRTPAHSHLSTRQYSSLRGPNDDSHHVSVLTQVSSYLDLVELTLLQQIQRKSTNFFSSLSTVRTLHDELQHALQSITMIRSTLSDANTQLITSGLSVIHTSKKIENASHLLQIGKRLRKILKCPERVRMLHSIGHTPTALGLIHDTRIMMFDHELKKINLISSIELSLIHCMKDINIQLQEEFTLLYHQFMEKKHENNYQSNNIYRISGGPNAAAGISGATSTSTPPSVLRSNSMPTGRRPTDAASDDDRNDLTSDEKEKLFSLSQCLYHLNGLNTVVQSYQTFCAKALDHRLWTILETWMIQAMAARMARPQSPILPAPQPALQTTPPHSSTPPTSHHRVTQSISINNTSGVASIHPFNDDGHSRRSTLPTSSSFTSSISYSPIAQPITSPPPVASLAVPPPAPTVPELVQRHIADLSHDHFLQHLNGLFLIIFDFLERIKSVSDVVLIGASSTPSPLFLFTQDPSNINFDIPPITLLQTMNDLNFLFNNTIINCIKESYLRIIKLFEWRKDIHRTLELNTLSTLLISVHSFIHNCDYIINKINNTNNNNNNNNVQYLLSLNQINNVLNQCVETYLDSLQTVRKRDVITAVEREQWNRIEVPREYQSFTDSRFERKLMIPVSSQSSISITGITETVGARVFFVERSDGDFDKFPICHAVLTLINTIAMYIDVMNTLTHYEVDVCLRLCELLLTFNMKCRERIMDGGAAKAVDMNHSLYQYRLPTITTNHLALCLTTIAFVATQIKTLESFIAQRFAQKGVTSTDHHNDHITTNASTNSITHINTTSSDNNNNKYSTLFTQFHYVYEEYTHHKIALMNKLSTVMIEYCSRDTIKDKISRSSWLQSASLAISYDTTNGATNADPAIRVLVTQCKSLNQTLSNYLSVVDRIVIFQNISKNICQLFMDFISNIDINKPYIRIRMQINILYLMKGLIELPGFERAPANKLCVLIGLSDETLTNIINESNNTNQVATNYNHLSVNGLNGEREPSIVSQSPMIACSSPTVSSTANLSVPPIISAVTATVPSTTLTPLLTPSSPSLLPILKTIETSDADNSSNSNDRILSKEAIVASDNARDDYHDTLQEEKLFVASEH